MIGSIRNQFLTFGGSVILLLLVASDRFERLHNYYSGLAALPLALLLGLLVLGCRWLTRGLADNSVGGSRENSYLPLLILLLFQLVFSCSFLTFADGRLIFSDDHSSFLYRLAVLREHFPTLGLYNAEWNAGYPMTEFPAVGIVGIYFLVWPILALLGDFSSVDGSYAYTLIIPYLYIFIVPWSVFAAARVLSVDRQASAFAGILAFGPTLLFFEWMLKFGTIGFAFSAGLFPLLFALCYRLAVSEEIPNRFHICAGALIAFLALTWPMTAIALVPLVIQSLCAPKTLLSPSRLRSIGLFIVLFLALFGPLLYNLASSSRALSIVSTSGTSSSGILQTDSHSSADELGPRKNEQGLRDIVKTLIKPFLRFNPLLLAFLLPGLMHGRQQRLRYALVSTILFLVLLGVYGDNFKAQLEFKRLFVHLGFLITIPCSVGILESLRLLLARSSREQSRPRSLLGLTLVALTLGAIILSPVPIAKAYLNRGDDNFIFASPAVSELASAIRQCKGEGRVIIPHFVLHELGATQVGSHDGGHVAPLALFTQKALYAFHFYHVLWQGLDAIPESYRDRGWEGVEEFIELINATCVVTFDPVWRRHFGRVSRYEVIYKTRQFRVFQRTGDEPGYFLKGSGKIKIKNQELFVTPAASDVVLKFRYHNRLRIDPQLGELYSVPAFHEDTARGVTQEVNFLGIRVTDKALQQGREIRIGF